MNHSNLKRVVFGLALAVGASACAYASPMTPADGNAADQKSEQPISDTWITTKVKADLATTDGVKSSEISVETTNGVVTLIGVLGSDTAVEKAIAVTKAIKGVKSVDSSGLKVR
ncbi:MAG: BON domain-containing protein [Xanthomonadales bacterium]|nr:BON domain-containing protein [Xanthomonadales bacterium]